MSVIFFKQHFIEMVLKIKENVKFNQTKCKRIYDLLSKKYNLFVQIRINLLMYNLPIISE